MQHHLETPCDVTLVVEGGKEIKAHRIILSKASSFFEKLLNTDMKEGREGVIHLEHCSARLMEDILESGRNTSIIPILDQNRSKSIKIDNN